MEPLYAQVEAALARRIADDLQPGDRLPSESELMTVFGVSRITVRRAVANLATRGLVDVIQGRGSFVATPRIEQSLRTVNGFVEDMTAAGLEATARLVTNETIAAPHDVADALRLEAGTPVTFIERIRLAAGRPVSFDVTYLPTDVGTAIARDDLERQPIFTLLEEKYDLPLVEADYRLQAVAAPERIADALQVAVGDPVMRVERTSRTADERPIDHEVLHYRGDAVSFATRLDRSLPG
ncbi:GntR family transcriptional regulator [Microlunatus soli]|uniref:Transcriptional regulator, GntR family n=1 Tax=Microlunatus soli TaxID=630515 RepID=A0A1H1MGK4_9ACTN|nr:GntR family transcriptional regulator [Microlunatus soli]SDR85974.1 transcriptional regulator, GntR family [Microlunatus soli]